MDIAEALGVAETTAAAKSALIRRMFRLGRFDPKRTLPSRLGDNPRAWMMEVNGRTVDVRHAPRQLQAAAFYKGLIPYIPADRDERTSVQPKKSPETPDLASSETAGNEITLVSSGGPAMLFLERFHDGDPNLLGEVAANSLGIVLIQALPVEACINSLLNRLPEPEAFRDRRG